MMTFAFRKRLSFSFFHQDPLKKAAKREIRQLENDCCVVLDRIFDEIILDHAGAERFLAEAQAAGREAREFLAQNQFARAKQRAEEGNIRIKLAMDLRCIG